MLSSVVDVCPCRLLLDTGVLAGIFKHEFKLEVMAVAVTGDQADAKYCHYDTTQRMKDQTLSDVEQAVLSNLERGCCYPFITQLTWDGSSSDFSRTTTDLSLFLVDYHY